MQYVEDGPDVPDRLLQAHEEGRVVFFCGAGISYPAGLPGFRKLTKKLYRRLGARLKVRDHIHAAIGDGQYDKAIDLLDRNVAGEDRTVRQAMADILLNPKRPDALDTHRALLDLGRRGDGRTRLVTTNFDRLFEEAVSRDGLSTERFAAPALPPADWSWDGLVYLHGLLPEESDGCKSPNQVPNLVVSSGDFGRAYLAEGWAARFVNQLFREFTVCFVGYSIEDPVMRYMVDAVAASRSRGGNPRDIFAFAHYLDSEETAQDAASKWFSKNVTPIVYHADREHAALHDTLHAWAKDEDGSVKERIVEQESLKDPTTITEDDDFVSRLRSVLRDSSGLPAKRFAEMAPPPSLDWLDPLDDMVFLTGAGTLDDSRDRVKVHLTDWLARHLDKQDLLLRLAARGGKPHPLLAEMISRRLQETPDAVQDSLLRKLWELALAGRVRGAPGQSSGLGLYEWKERFERDGLTTALRLELRERLTPCVSLGPPPYNEASLSELLASIDGEDGNVAAELERLKDEDPDLLKPTRDIVLATGCAYQPLRALAKSGKWRAALPALLDDLTGLLRDALDLMREVGKADDREDPSDSALPSIAEHPQNLDLHDWSALIELNRDAWLATAGVSPERALAAAEGWMRSPYPVFRRLALFAAARQSGPVPPARALDWLLEDDCRWLWAPNTRREACRLVAALPSVLDPAGMDRLERAVLAGPPRGMYVAGLEEEAWTRIKARATWLPLAKMDEAGAALSADARDLLARLSAEYTDLELSEDGQEEFSFWMGPAESVRPQVFAPEGEDELVAWLRDRPGDQGPWPENLDDWRERCRADFDGTAAALKTLAAEGTWQAQRWRDALQAWPEEELRQRSWEDMAPVMERMPREVLQKIASAVSRWLQAVAASFEGGDETFLSLCERVLALDYEDEGPWDEPVTVAINHPVGQVAEALLRRWRRREPEDGQGLQDPDRSIFTDLCDPGERKFRHGRVLLAAHAVSLFRVDPDWTILRLLPFFSWEGEEAVAAWKSFLWSPRFHRPLMKKLKTDFLAAATHYDMLLEGQRGYQYAARYVEMLTVAALERMDVFSKAECATATAALPPKGLAVAASTLSRAMDNAGDGRRKKYWRKRAAPYLESIWPQGINGSEAVSNALARACIAAGDAFPDAVKLASRWLLRTPRPEADDIVMHLLDEADMASHFPCAALELLHRTVADEAVLYSGKMGKVLRAAQDKRQALVADPRFRRLAHIVQKNGGDMD